MEFNYNKLRGRIVEIFGTLKDFSDKLDITYESLSKKMNNKIDISSEEVVKWCELLAIEPDEIGSYFFTLKV